MFDETIPLYDGEPFGAKIIHLSKRSIKDAGDTSGGEATTTLVLRSKRGSSRKGCEDVHICFCPNDISIRPEYVECPLIDMSDRGFAIEFDLLIRAGVRGMIAYRTVSRRPVHISCGVRNCRSVGEGRYIVGIRLDRRLDFEERRPAKYVPGRAVAPGIQARKLHPLTPDHASHDSLS